MSDYDRLIFEMRLFADEYIVHDTPQTSIVNRGNQLINKNEDDMGRVMYELYIYTDRKWKDNMKSCNHLHIK